MSTTRSFTAASSAVATDAEAATQNAAIMATGLKDFLIIRKRNPWRTPA
jgi:hypothetical protein